MSEANVVLLIGWNPDVVDYSKWPGLTPEKLRAGLEGDSNKLKTQGYDASLGLIDSAQTACATVKKLLSHKRHDCVLIGAGVRTVSDYLRLFESLVNTVHAWAPKASICFNSGPFDSVEAVQRWLPSSTRSG